MCRLYTEYYSNGKNIEKLASSRQYRDIFNSKFNITFLKPKKDQCDMCSVFNLADETEKAASRENYRHYTANKLVARDMKDNDKQHAINDKTVCVKCSDLQKVLATLLSNVSDFYYNTRMSHTT
nr:unnamed protein product [Callosobruchus analis]